MFTKKNINIFIVAAESIGLSVDSRVVASALVAVASELDFNLVIHEVNVPRKALDTTDNSVAIEFPVQPHIIINLEQIYKLSDPQSEAALHILIPNPEWISPLTGERVLMMTQIWHKTRYSKFAMQSAFPKQEHVYVGFTSIDPGCAVKNNRNFAHFKGKSVTRNSDKILNIWYRRQDLPNLKLQFFTNSLEADFFVFPEWLNWKNIYVKMGNVSTGDYFTELSDANIHLCTSEVEGFGHYLNESRAMGAVIITVDASPMNELIDEKSGILIPPVATTRMSLGTRHLISEDGLEQAIDRALAMNDEELRIMGFNARKRFLEDRKDFIDRLNVVFLKLIRNHF